MARVDALSPANSGLEFERAGHGGLLRRSCALPERRSSSGALRGRPAFLSHNRGQPIVIETRRVRGPADFQLLGGQNLIEDFLVAPAPRPTARALNLSSRSAVRGVK